MRAISPSRQTGVATHLFNPFEQFGETATPLNSTWESASPLKFGQDLVKVSAELKRTEETITCPSHTVYARMEFVARTAGAAADSANTAASESISFEDIVLLLPGLCSGNLSATLSRCAGQRRDSPYLGVR